MTGPFGGDVTALSIDPRNSDHILAGTSDGQIYRTIDGGAIWRRIRPGIRATGFTVTVILFDSEKPDRIYVGVKAVTALGEEGKGGAAYLSEDNGENWREIEGMHGRLVRSIVQSSKDANVLVASTLEGIYRSLDRGQKWEMITPANDPELRNFHAVAIDPRDVDTIYAGTSHLPWKTTDGGKTWKRAGTKETGMIDDSDIMAIHIDEANPEVVLMSACSGIYRSLDSSAKWSKIQGIPYSSRRTHIIYQHPTKPEVIFAGTTEGLWLSTNGGKTDSWRRATSAKLVINSIAIHPGRPDRIFLGTEDNGVLISNDGGENYEPSNAGFINRHVSSLIADIKQPGRIYAGILFDSSNGGLFISEDGGLTWQQSMNGMGVRDVYSLHQIQNEAGTLYAGTNYGIFRSDDQGRNWTPVKKEEPIVDARNDKSIPYKKVSPSTPAAPAPAAPSTPATKPAKATAPPEKSSRPRRVGDAGQTPGFELIVNTRKKTATAAKTKKQGVAKRPMQAKKGKPTPSKKPVKPAPKPVPPVSDLVDLQSQVFELHPFIAQSGQADQVEKEWLIASTWDGLFRTEDEKKGWKEIKLRKPALDDPVQVKQPRIYNLATSKLAPGAIFLGTEEGLYISRDNGETFSLVILDEEGRRVRAIEFDPRSPDRIFAGTSAGFFRSTDGGKTWSRRGGGMPVQTNISAITINPLNPDEIYTSDDMRGSIYYSRDSGTNWEKLDISLLPSTLIRALTGDPFDKTKLYVGSYSGGVYVMSHK